MANHEYILRAVAPDAIGVLADVATLVANHRLSVTKSEDFADVGAGRFFIWQTLEAPAEFGREGFEAAFADMAARREMEWSLRPVESKPRAIIMVSKGDHCLVDLLHRHRRGRLGAEIAAVVSNHETLRWHCLLYTSPSPRDQRGSRMPSSA